MLHIKFQDDFKSSIPVLWRVRKMVMRTFSPLLWRQRLLVWTCGILIGLLAAAFSEIADKSQAFFMHIVHINRFIPLIMTPAVFALAAGATLRWFPSIPGSGIPQAIAARELHDKEARQWLLGARSIFGKIFLTALCLMSGASIGREGPTVQVGAALLMMCAAFRVLNTDRSLILAGAAAGVAAAFNTPIAGIVFAIEEMARGFHRRNSTLILMSIVLSGAASMTILGNYNYFGLTTKNFVLATDWIPLLVIGVFGGLGGALFTWMLTHGLQLMKRITNRTPLKNPMLFAAVCGLIVAVLGLMTHGDTYGTGYGLA
ncbi:MAG: chloride channel protein, partial [Alphaproteobacteria bacterium]|nr:chloride channel protein [Alphaproteobacteria bacterium]